MSNFNNAIRDIVGKQITDVEWTGSLPDEEGYLLTFSDGTKILFSWYSNFDCSGVSYEIFQKEIEE